MTVCISPGGQDHFETASPSNEVLVGTLNGVRVLTRSAPGADWGETRRTLEGKHISALSIEPTRGTIFAGTYGDGLYASADGGQTWTRKDRGIADGDIYALGIVRAGDELRIYAGTEPARLYVSTDLGESWTELPALRDVPGVENWTFPGPPHVAHVKHITFDPRSPDTIYASIEVGGLLKSTDAGQSWRCLTGFEDDVHRITVTAARPDAVYMANGLGGVYSSPDAGENWQILTDKSARIAYPDALIVAPQRPDLVFTAGGLYDPGAWYRTRDADASIGRSRDGGRTWEYLAGGLPAHIRGNIEAMALNAYPGGFALYAGTTDGEIFYSEDEGEHWTTIARSLPPVSKGGHYRNLRDDAPAATAAS